MVAVLERALVVHDQDVTREILGRGTVTGGTVRTGVHLGPWEPRLLGRPVGVGIAVALATSGEVEDRLRRRVVVVADLPGRPERSPGRARVRCRPDRVALLRAADAGARVVEGDVGVRDEHAAAGRRRVRLDARDPIRNDRVLGEPVEDQIDGAVLSHAEGVDARRVHDRVRQLPEGVRLGSGVDAAVPRDHSVVEARVVGEPRVLVLDRVDGGGALVLLLRGVGLGVTGNLLGPLVLRDHFTRVLGGMRRGCRLSGRGGEGDDHGCRESSDDAARDRLPCDRPLSFGAQLSKVSPHWASSLFAGCPQRRMSLWGVSIEFSRCLQDNSNTRALSMLCNYITKT